MEMPVIDLTNYVPMLTTDDENKEYILDIFKGNKKVWTERMIGLRLDDDVVYSVLFGRFLWSYREKEIE